MTLSYKHPLAGLVMVLWAAVFLPGCVGITTVGDRSSPAPSVNRVDLSASPEPWRGPAGKLAQRGFTQEQLEAVFKSPNLQYSSKPMGDKLKELYGIYFRSDLTKAIQENLYQLGYDVRIDGQNGSGTREAVGKFQRDAGLTVTGEVSQATLDATRRTMKGRTLRALSSYTPPPAPQPSRAATYPQFTRPDALARIAANYRADREMFQRLGRKYQVPGEVVAAIMWVETGYGQYFGKQKAAGMLASMAAAASDFSLVAPAVADLPQDRESMAFMRETAVKRGDWALNELAALMTYALANGHDPTTFPGSVYGAVGWGQFMPSNILKFGVSAKGSGRVDIFNKEDAAFSIGNYLKGHGWRGEKVNSMAEDERREVIMKYNKSGVYVNTVLYVADYLARQ